MRGGRFVFYFKVDAPGPASATAVHTWCIHGWTDECMSEVNDVKEKHVFPEGLSVDGTICTTIHGQSLFRGNVISPTENPLRKVEFSFILNIVQLGKRGELKGAS